MSGRVGRGRKPTWWARMCWEAVLVAREGSADPSEGPGGVSRPTRISGRGQESPEVWERVGRATLMSKMDWEAHPEILDGLGSPSRGPEAVGRPTRRFGRGQEAPPEFWEWSGSPTGDPGGVGSPP